MLDVKSDVDIAAQCGLRGRTNCQPYGCDLKRTIGEGTVDCDPSWSAKGPEAVLAADWPQGASNLANVLGGDGLCGLPAQQERLANHEGHRLPLIENRRQLVAHHFITKEVAK